VFLSTFLGVTKKWGAYVVLGKNDENPTEDSLLSATPPSHREEEEHEDGRQEEEEEEEENKTKGDDNDVPRDSPENDDDVPVLVTK